MAIPQWVPGTRLYPLVPPLPVLLESDTDHLLSAVSRVYAGGRTSASGTTELPVLASADTGSCLRRVMSRLLDHLEDSAPRVSDDREAARCPRDRPGRGAAFRRLLRARDGRVAVGRPRRRPTSCSASVSPVGADLDEPRGGLSVHVEDDVLARRPHVDRLARVAEDAARRTAARRNGRASAPPPSSASRAPSRAASRCGSRPARRRTTAPSRIGRDGHPARVEDVERLQRGRRRPPRGIRVAVASTSSLARYTVQCGGTPVLLRGGDAAATCLPFRREDRVAARLRARIGLAPPAEELRRRTRPLRRRPGSSRRPRSGCPVAYAVTSGMGALPSRIR